MAAGASFVWITVFMRWRGVKWAPHILAEMAQALISSLEKLIGTPRDGALLRYSLGGEYLKAGDKARAIASRLRKTRCVCASNPSTICELAGSRPICPET